jgi:hypothetical protein
MKILVLYNTNVSIRLQADKIAECGIWSAATRRRFRKARQVAPDVARASLQAPEKRRRAGALPKVKFGVLANLVPIASSCIFNYVLINKALCSC